MAFGDSPYDEGLRSAWKEFCERLQEAGERVFKDYNPAAPLHRADGFRFGDDLITWTGPVHDDVQDCRVEWHWPVEASERRLAADPALVHARGGDGQTPLHFASSVEIAAYLLDQGTDIDARDVDHDKSTDHEENRDAHQL